MAAVTPEDLQVLLDRNAIRQLLYRFDLLVDQGDLAGAMAWFCTEEFEYDAGRSGAIMMSDRARSCTRAMRRDPVIDVAGNEARMEWHDDVHGPSEIHFRRVDGDWRIAKLPAVPHRLPSADHSRRC